MNGRHILIGAFIIFFSPLIGQVQSNQLLPWHQDKRLTWPDFQGEPEGDIDFKAMTNWQLSFDFQLSKAKGEINTHFNVYTFFDNQKSWVREGNGSEQLLQHEQLHFDIAELFARKLRKQFAIYSFKSENYQEELNLLFDASLDSCNVVQTQYDLDTEHGLNQEKQQEWLQKIDQELMQLNEFVLVSH
ncbi:MAG: DUF922 domain-containing protein [Bacteroidetes bacterium]|nr:DUF922 domain-containing protein [Bacteroidota bacterium]MCZ6900962.1 DUF922 domain-containing protein [Bacteroidota bacterium]